MIKENMTKEENDNKRLLDVIEGVKRFKHCLSCDLTFFEGTVCPHCKHGWVYGYEDEDNNITFEDDKENDEEFKKLKKKFEEDDF